MSLQTSRSAQQPGAEQLSVSVPRRRFLTSAGAVAATLAAGSTGLLGYRAYDQGLIAGSPGSAFNTWDDWTRGSSQEQMVKAAILSANPHNSQPWSFRIATSRIDVYADMTRATGANDPLNRELYIGLGCAIENLVLTGSALGIGCEVSYMPSSGESDHVARIELSDARPVDSPLYHAISHRHSNRGPYSSRPIGSADVMALGRLSGEDASGPKNVWFCCASDRMRVAEGVIAATEAFIQDDEQSSDAHAWFRTDWDDIRRKKDGLTFDGAGLSPLLTAVAKLLPAQSRQESDSAWLKQTRETQVKTAAAFGIIAVPDPFSHVQQMQGGRLLQRVHLHATSEGIALQHLNQMTQRADRERQLGLPSRFGNYLSGLLEESSMHALTTFRVGFAERKAKRSPRRPINEVLVSG